MSLNSKLLFYLILLLSYGVSLQAEQITLNQKADGYRGIWYMNQPSNDEYVYKYSGGLGTYCAKHRPFAVYAEAVNKTFFCYGGAPEGNSRKLLHMVSFYDHASGKVPRPTLLLDKKTSDAHDNPVIQLDDKGHIWIFSTSHGTSRPSYIHRSKRPYDIDEFELIEATRRESALESAREIAIDNFSYMQAWHIAGRGFIAFFTVYGDPAARTLFCMTSKDGVAWNERTRIAAIDEGHYQISAAKANVAGTAFNYHPKGKGLNWRTNLYYAETRDFGETWASASGKALEFPLTEPKNDALVIDYESQGLLVYLKDILFDASDRPVILYLTSKGYESGPKNDPRMWRIAHWTGEQWTHRTVTESDNNYDMGSLFIESGTNWRIIAPTSRGPQAYNPGGEMAMWTSRDAGATWRLAKQLTSGSERNHTYARAAMNAYPDFYALWADGHARQPSESRLYICTRDGEVFMLPEKMDEEFEKPILLR